MKILHTSDWHVGKVLKGQSRLAEQIAVLADIVATAERERPDLIVVAGDLYDTAAPQADAEKVVIRALTALRRHAAAVVVVAGNHDHGGAMDALRPLADGVGITLRGALGRPEDHLVTGETTAGEAWRLAALPFLSQRYAVRATEMFDLTAAQNSATYADQVARLIGVLTASFEDGTPTVNLVTAHLTVVGGTLGGGERDAHTIEAYAVPSSVFPTSTHYVALGHLHRRQVVPGPCPVHYCGSPFAVDFGEEENIPSVSIVEVGPTTPARVKPCPIQSAVPLRTLRGTLAQLTALAGEAGGVDQAAWLRIYVREPARAGIKEEVRDLFARALEIRIDPLTLPESASAPPPTARAGRSPTELFAEYLAAKGIGDEPVAALFNQLHDDVLTGTTSTNGAALGRAALGRAAPGKPAVGKAGAREAGAGEAGAGEAGAGEAVAGKAAVRKAVGK